MTRKKYRFKRKADMAEADTYAQVEVTWIDPMSDSSWLEIKEFLIMNPATCNTTGRLYTRKDSCTYIFGDWASDKEGNIDTVGNVTVIPNSLIKEIKVKK